MNHRFRQALRLILLMAGLCLAWSGTAQDDDVNDLLATLRDQVAFEAQLVTDLADPDLHEAERAGKQEQLDNARLQIGRLREAIAKAGIMVEIRPGGIVEVKDPSSGASDRLSMRMNGGWLVTEMGIAPGRRNGSWSKSTLTGRKNSRSVPLAPVMRNIVCRLNSCESNFSRLLRTSTLWMSARSPSVSR